MQSFWNLVASIMFACMGAGVKYSLENGASLSSVIIFRSFPSVACILIWALLTHHSLKTRYPMNHLKRNIFGVSGMWLTFFTLGMLPLATSTSLSYTSSLFIGLYVVWSAKHIKTDLVRLCAVLLGFAGITLVLKPSINADLWLGVVTGLCAGLASAFAMFQVKALGKLGEPVWRTVFYFSLISTLTGLFMLEKGDLTEVPIQTWIVLVLTGFFGMFGQLAMTQAYGAGSPIIAAVLQYSTIIFSALLGILFWDVIPDMIAWLGMLMVILAGAGIVLADQQMALKHKFKAIVHKNNPR
ncbi:MAG: DMT family transporter [Pelistega sp.]|nr:DMT family transporter [Pelistega sp.]